MSGNIKKLFIIAGEESGDNIGSKLIAQIKESHPEIEIKGIGGDKMRAQGLVSNFNMKEINLMGFFEIIPHIPNLLKRINQTVQDIIEFDPEYVVTIDSPGFNYRVAKRLRKAGFKGKLVHYVAPTVWAYKEKRARKTAKLFDKLLCILPWEPPYFEKEGLDTKFVGHPVFEDMKFLDSKGKEKVRKNYLISKNDVVISCLVGSRQSEVNKLAGIYSDALKDLQKKFDNIKIFILSTENMKPHLEKMLREFSGNAALITEQEEKYKLLQVSNAAIVKSGTIGLEVASYKCPHVICYKVNPLSYRLIKSMIKTRFVNLVNISAGMEIIPELIQEDCTSESISRIITEFLSNKELAKKQAIESEIELKKMGLKSRTSPSKLAMKEIFG